ncbi:MAG: PilN domain-containing protein [Bacteroidota bacterium]
MIRVNLLPPEYRPQPQVKPVRILIALGIVAAVAGVAGGAVWAWTYRQGLIDEIAAIEQKRLEYGPLYDKVVMMEATLAEINKQLETKNKLTAGLLAPVAIFRAMEAHMPQEVSFGNLNITADKKVSFNGTADDFIDVAALHLKLKLSPVFGDVAMGSAWGGGAGGGSFNMTCGGGGGRGAP